MTAERRDVAELVRWSAQQAGASHSPGYCSRCLDKTALGRDGFNGPMLDLRGDRHPRCAELIDGVTA